MESSDRSPHRLSVLLEEMITLIHRQFAGASLRVMAEEGLTMPQIVTLQILACGDALTISGLQDRLKLSASATSHLVDRLVEKRFITRAEDPDDRRQKRVQIAPEGARLIGELSRERLGEFARILSGLEPDLQADLLDAVERTTLALRARLPLAEPPKNSGE